MKIYFSGISGTGLGPLALFAKAAGCEVVGSDAAAGAVTPELEKAGIRVAIGEQTGANLLAENKLAKIDWLVYSSAIPPEHPELYVAGELGIKATKRDEFIAWLVAEKNLKMVAVAGTHGKTTTTSAMIWACLNLGLPVDWLVGTTLGFADAGKYAPGAQHLIYEADEYDRNFLHYSPWLTAITAVSYDHPDIYPTPEDYLAAFEQFKTQSARVIELPNEADARLEIAGELRRQDITLAMMGVEKIAEDLNFPLDYGRLVEIMNNFPGVGRRFEKIADAVYSDYAHHPEEIMATLQMASEEAGRLGKSGVVAIYEPHQNVRQHKVRAGYAEAFDGVARLFWLPTYLTREDASLSVIRPEEFIAGLSVKEVAEAAEADETLAQRLRDLRAQGFLILMMTAGPADGWLRSIFGNA